MYICMYVYIFAIISCVLQQVNINTHAREEENEEEAERIQQMSMALGK